MPCGILYSIHTLHAYVRMYVNIHTFTWLPSNGHPPCSIQNQGKLNFSSLLCKPLRSAMKGQHRGVIIHITVHSISMSTEWGEERVTVRWEDSHWQALHTFSTWNGGHVQWCSPPHWYQCLLLSGTTLHTPEATRCSWQHYHWKPLGGDFLLKFSSNV